MLKKLTKMQENVNLTVKIQNFTGPHKSGSRSLSDSENRDFIANNVRQCERTFDKSPPPKPIPSLSTSVSGRSRIFAGGAPTLRGRQDTILQNVPKNCMKLRKIRSLGRHAGGAPSPDPLLEVFMQQQNPQNQLKPLVSFNSVNVVRYFKLELISHLNMINTYKIYHQHIVESSTSLQYILY